MSPLPPRVNCWIWMTSSLKAEKVCRKCLDMQGRVYRLDQEFYPLHHGCNCWPQAAYIENPPFEAEAPGTPGLKPGSDPQALARRAASPYGPGGYGISVD